MPIEKVREQLKGIGFADQRDGFYSNVARISYMDLDEAFIIDFLYLYMAVTKKEASPVNLNVDKSDMELGRRIVMTPQTALKFYQDLGELIERVVKTKFGDQAKPDRTPEGE